MGRTSTKIGALNAANLKRSRLWNSLLRALTAAAREGKNVDGYVNRCKDAGLNKSKIRAAIDRASSNSSDLSGNTMEIECKSRIYSNGARASLVIKALSDNSKNTVNKVKAILNKHNANMEKPGSLKYFFHDVNQVVVGLKPEVITAKSIDLYASETVDKTFHDISEEFGLDLFDSVIDAGADDMRLIEVDTDEENSIGDEKDSSKEKIKEHPFLREWSAEIDTTLELSRDILTAVNETTHFQVIESKQIKSPRQESLIDIEDSEDTGSLLKLVDDLQAYEETTDVFHNVNISINENDDEI